MDLLRLDCGIDIKGLRKYYEQNGFKAVGEVTVAGEHLILYEKSLKQNCASKVAQGEIRSPIMV